MKLSLQQQLAMALLLVIAGSSMLYAGNPSLHIKHSVAPINQAVSVKPADQVVQGKPIRIQIPSLDIDLPVIDGQYNSQEKTWTLSNDKAHFALITPPANNQNGNTFIYGHALPNVFGRLPGISPGAEVIISTDTNRAFTYTFRSSYETNPNDDQLFHYDGPPILTLQTCTGIWSQNRSLYTFDFKEVS